MNAASKVERLAALVAHARRILAASPPASAHLLQVLDALTAQEVQELGQDHPDNERTGSILQRLTRHLNEHWQVVEDVLERCLRLDLEDHSCEYAAWERRYLESGETAAVIERSLRGPRQTVVSFIHHFVLGQWEPARQDFTCLRIEDDNWAVVCKGYLVSKGRAFPTSLSLLEASMQQRWGNWQALWRWF